MRLVLFRREEIPGARTAAPPGKGRDWPAAGWRAAAAHSLPVQDAPDPSEVLVPELQIESPPGARLRVKDAKSRARRTGAP